MRDRTDVVLISIITIGSTLFVIWAILTIYLLATGQNPGDLR